MSSVFSKKIKKILKNFKNGKERGGKGEREKEINREVIISINS
jgi:hypothetical protein